MSGGKADDQPDRSADGDREASETDGGRNETLDRIVDLLATYLP